MARLRLKRPKTAQKSGKIESKELKLFIRGIESPFSVDRVFGAEPATDAMRIYAQDVGGQVFVRGGPAGTPTVVSNGSDNLELIHANNTIQSLRQEVERKNIELRVQNVTNRTNMQRRRATIMRYVMATAVCSYIGGGVIVACFVMQNDLLFLLGLGMFGASGVLGSMAGHVVYD